MKAITVTEPFATLLATGAKHIETRSWTTMYRGPIAIHASKKFTSDDLAYAIECDALAPGHAHGPSAVIWPDFAVRRAGLLKTAFGLTRGCVIATARLTHCAEFTPAALEKIAEKFGWQELELGNFELGRFGFLLEDVRLLSEPLPAVGALGLWDWPLPMNSEAA